MTQLPKIIVYSVMSVKQKYLQQSVVTKMLDFKLIFIERSTYDT